jgi:hypothetical protein
VKERSLKDEMRNALRGDRERAKARRRAEAEGAAKVPQEKPVLDLNRPITELKRPAPPSTEAPPSPEPAPARTPRRGFLARLFRRWRGVSKRST